MPSFLFVFEKQIGDKLFQLGGIVEIWKSLKSYTHLLD